MARVAALAILMIALATGAGAADPPAHPDLADQLAAVLDPATAPRRVQRSLFAAGALRDRDELDEARAVLRRQLADHPEEDHALLRFHLGNILALADSLDAARLQLERAVVLEPRLQPAWRNLGEVAYTTGDDDRAAAAFARAADLDPAADPVLRYYQGVALVQGGRGAEALPILLALVTDHPAADLDWYRALVGAAVDADRAGAVTARMDTLTARFPDDADAWHLAYQQALAADDLDRATTRLTVTGHLRPLTPAERVQLGDLCLAVDAPLRAAAHYEAALADGGDDAADLDRLVAARLAAHDVPAALAALDRRLAAEPSAAAWRTRGEVLYGLEDFSGALEALGEAARLAPDDAGLDLLRGYCCLELERWDEAVVLLDAATRDERQASRAREALDHARRHLP